MSLSLVTPLPSFSTFTFSSSSPLSLCISCNHNQVNEAEDHRLMVTSRRTALVALGVLTTAPFSNQRLLATGSPGNGSNNSAMLPEFGSEPRPLNSVIRVLVPRPSKPRNEADQGEENVEVLVVNGIEVQNNKPVKFDVYIAQPEDGDDDEKGGSGLGELAGSLVELASLRLRRRKLRKLGLNLGIDWVLEEIGAEDCDKLVVSLVPRIGDVVIGGIYIDYIKGA